MIRLTGWVTSREQTRATSRERLSFQYEAEAKQLWVDLAGRFAKFGLELHRAKTRLLEFGRHAARDRERNGRGKPENFDFLGFTHVCARNRKGRFEVLRRTSRKRVRRKLREIKIELKRRLHVPVPAVGKWLAAVLRGHFNYYGVPSNYQALKSFRFQVTWLWWRTLKRRSQKARIPWKRMLRLVLRYLPAARIAHSSPAMRFHLST